MARKNKAPATKRVKRHVSLLPVIPQEPTATLADGRTLTRGSIVTVGGVEGVFRFQYARHTGREITVYGGTGTGETAYHSFRTFVPERILTVGTNQVTEKLVEKATAGLPAEYAAMSPGQKAAYTKRMRAAAQAMPVAA